MKIKWWLCILWRVFSLSIAISTSGIYGSPSVSRPVGRRKILKLGTSQGVGDLLTAHLSSTANRKSSPRILSHSISFRTPQLTPAPVRIYSSPPPEIQRPTLLDRTVPKSQPDFATLPDVSVTCSSGDFVVRVKRNFYGFEADTDELTLGSTCKSNGVLMPYGDLLFSYPLMECDGKRQVRLLKVIKLIVLLELTFLLVWNYNILISSLTDATGLSHLYICAPLHASDLVPTQSASL